MIEIFLKSFKNYRWSIFLFALISLVALCFSIIVPLINGKFLDLLVLKENENKITTFIVFFAIISMISIFLNYIASILKIKLQADIIFNIKMFFVRHIRKSPLIDIKRYNAAYLNQRINNDITDVVSFLLNNVFSIITVIIQIMMVFCVLMKFDIKFGIIALLFSPIYFLCYKLFKNKIYSSSFQLKESANNMFGVFFDQINNIENYKIDVSYRKQNVRLSNAYNDYRVKLVSNGRITNEYLCSNDMLVVLFRMLFLLIGGGDVIKGNLTIGMLTVLISYFSLIQSGIQVLVGFGNNYQINKAAFTRLEKLLLINEEKRGGIKINEVNEIYAEINTLFHRKCNIILLGRKGDIIKIEGENGSGKSTIFKILIGLYDIGNNIIKYNDIDIVELDMEYIRENWISFVSQEHQMDNVLVKDLFDIYDVNSDKSQIERILDEENIKFLDEIWESSMNELSGGQAQKVCILRKILKSSSVMFFDEPTSSLDKENRKWFYNLISSIRDDKIIFLIDHIQDEHIMATKIISLENSTSGQ